MVRDRTYRATFRKGADQWVGLDFYAENLDFARAHAGHVAYVEEWELLKVRALNQDDVFDAGSFYPVALPPPAAPELAKLLRYPAPLPRRRGKGVA